MSQEKKDKKPIQVDEDVELLPAVRQEKSLVPLDPLAAYLQEIRKYEGLTEDEERELALRYKETGDVAAAYRLITANLSLVVRIAMTFKREWQNMMDLVQEGNLGLMKAVKNFDPFRNVRLSAYATWWIKSYILKYILDNWRLVKVGTTNVRRKLLFNLRKEQEKLEREGFVATPKLLAERFGADEEDVIDVDASIGAADVSMDTPTHPDSSLTPMATLSDGRSPDQDVEVKLFRTKLREKIDSFKVDLKPIEIDLLDQRILSESPKSLQEIGDEYAITREAVRQAEQRLLKKFKTYIEDALPEVAEFFK